MMSGFNGSGATLGVFIRPDAHPVTKRDLATIAAARRSNRAAFLLAAIHPIGASNSYVLLYILNLISFIILDISLKFTYNSPVIGEGP